MNVVQQKCTCASKPLMAVTGTCLASRGCMPSCSMPLTLDTDSAAAPGRVRL